MKIDQALHQLVAYGIQKNLIHSTDKVYITNRLLELFELSGIEDPPSDLGQGNLLQVLQELTDYAERMDLIPKDSLTYRDLFDTKVIGCMVPKPSDVISKFELLRAKDPIQATDWFYAFNHDVNYIRTDRISRDVRWTVETEYGEINITINLSKPEKDPKAIAAARNLPSATYPKCPLCVENEGYSGRVDHPARQNHRMVPVTLMGEPWYFQYSPYVYYHEHCIVLNREHRPMKINRDCFAKLLDFVSQFPHYFVGSNADLPIVGGSILSHDHFQGGRFHFAMEKAEVQYYLTIRGFEDVSVGVVNWPLSVLRIAAESRDRLIELGDKILQSWQTYTDEAAMIFAETNGEPHNTITPIARIRDGRYELDLVLRNNLTTDEHPLGLYHPHAEIHHIKKENIGLIEVMGLAVLPARLKEELALVAEGLLNGRDLRIDPRTAHHADWAESIAKSNNLTRENIDEVLRKETGKTFLLALEHAGVFKRTDSGRRAFDRFLQQL